MQPELAPQFHAGKSRPFATHFEVLINHVIEINFAVISVKKASEKPELFSPQMLQSNLDDGVKSFMTFFKNIGSKGFILNKNSESHASNSSSLSHTESNG
ncbi:hypothetical protein DEO72_LG10g2804 [Vigna unguiculata]|uniref:Uncharacterized protein n=1 Tax=Vigna unguiculata TaxID=3917 RepID=A0A4D6NF78_VIGUN|nr:hypothetical protein DEO72_LG10g2804 [Vigna unguiculata]